MGKHTFHLMTVVVDLAGALDLLALEAEEFLELTGNQSQLSFYILAHLDVVLDALAVVVELDSIFLVVFLQRRTLLDLFQLAHLDKPLLHFAN